MNNTARPSRPSKSAARTSIMTVSELRLFTATGEELLMMAIAGHGTIRRRINQELDLRSLLAEGPRRRRVAAPRIAQRRAA